MGLDSVEIVLSWEESFGVRITDEEAAKLLTPRMAIDLLVKKLDADPEALGGCLTSRAFHRLRKSLCHTVGIPKREVRPTTRLCDLLPESTRHTKWREVQKSFGIPLLPNLTWGIGSGVKPVTVGDFACWVVSNSAKNFQFPNQRWTRSQIRAVVRAIVTDVCDVRDFSDDDQFVRDIGVD